MTNSQNNIENKNSPILDIQGISIQTVKPTVFGITKKKSKEKDKIAASTNIKDIVKSEVSIEPLLCNLELSAYPGEIVLLLGASGTGKSLLANLILGFVSSVDKGIVIKSDHSKAHFSVKLEQSPTEYNLLNPIYPTDLEGKIGVMFQSLGLFDDLTVGENWEIANDQSQLPLAGTEWNDWKRETLKSLGLDDSVLQSNIHKLSGGQKQRVAFGRLLAFQPDIMILDEPTSALDISTAQQVVGMIQKTHKKKILENKKCLTLIITHDYENFIQIADRVWYISPGGIIQKEDGTTEKRTGGHVENHFPPKSKTYYEKDLCTKRYPDEPSDYSQEEWLRHEARCQDIAYNTLFLRFFQSLIRAMRPKNYRWWRKFFGIMWKLLVMRALLYILVTGFFLGLVCTYFSLNLNLGSVQLASGTKVKVEQFILPTFFREMLSGFGIVMFRALIPLFTCIFIAARSGTAITSYLSSMRDNERRQWDSLQNLGIEPHLFFFPQIVICFVLGCWILSYLSFLCAALGSLLVALATNPLCTWYTWMDTFWKYLYPQPLFDVISFIPIFAGFGMFTLKTMVVGFAIACISFSWGVKLRKNTLETIHHLMGANICNMVAILLVFFILLIIELG